VGAGPEGEGDVPDDGGAGEREVVEQEHWDSEDAHAQDAEFVRHSGCGKARSHAGCGGLFKPEVWG